MAATTVATVALALAVLAKLASLTGQPITVALFGVVIAMISSVAVNDPEPGQRVLTTALVPLPAVAAVTLGALLAPHLFSGDAVFVVIMMATVYVRRFGVRAMALGMVAFISYFFALFLHATLAQLPALGVAVVIGVACSLLMRNVVVRDSPERELARLLRAFRARLGAVIGAAADGLVDGSLTPRSHRRLQHLLIRLNDSALMVENRIDDGLGSEPALRVFDAELATERLVGLTVRVLDGDPAAPGADHHRADRHRLADLLGQLRAALRTERPAGLDDRVQGLADRLSAAEPVDDPVVNRLRIAVVAVVRAALATPLTEAAPAAVDEPEQAPGDGPDDAADQDDPAADGELTGWLRVTTRQSVQVGVAGTLAIVAGELISPTRWYWAAITAFVIYAGTASSGETLSKGWQRVLGTVGGVVAGVLVAALVGGNGTISLVLIGVCIFFAFYLVQVSPAGMIFWITMMLALLYGLLGQFSVGLLLVRLEETAAGAAIGVVVAYLVLPTSTRNTVGGNVQTVLDGVGELLCHAVNSLLGDTDGARLVSEARKLGENMRTLRTSAKPLTDGLAGIAGRSGVRHGLRVLRACDHHARGLARLCTVPVADPAMLRPGLSGAAVRVRHNVGAVAAAVNEGDRSGEVSSAQPLLDRAEDAVTDCPPAERERVLAVVRHLRRIDQAVVGLAADVGLQVPQARSDQVPAV
ncbi:MAG: FUSC family protein [Pseudonocardiales bacterium]|nr:MAG: FUSC family protein [Pseudonocardiales bacterium]